ncbi:hypothetical protein ACJMK2_026328 [Sinanodonta woodiana]|uniref:Uncharacterized protein n=1 Tax=Sinanodonta woodiana TaxID=1069815 RepID=A0ABD3XMT0_SINWO
MIKSLHDTLDKLVDENENCKAISNPKHFPTETQRVFTGDSLLKRVEMGDLSADELKYSDDEYDPPTKTQKVSETQKVSTEMGKLSEDELKRERDRRRD